MPYFTIPKILRTTARFVSVAIIAHGQYYGLKHPLFCLKSGCRPGGPKVEYKPVAAIGNVNFSGPTKDNRFFTSLRNKNSLYEAAKEVFQTILHYTLYRGDPDVQINSGRIVKQTVTSNICLPNKLLSFTEDITPGPRFIISEHATRFNHGVYIGRNNLGLPEGIKIDIDRFIQEGDGDVTLETLVKHLIDLFDLEDGDTLEITDTSCAVLMSYAGGKNARVNRREARSLQNIIEDVNKGISPNRIYTSIIADKTSKFEEYLKGESEIEKNRKLQSYNQELMTEFRDYLSLPANEAVAGIGGYKKRQTRKLKSGFLKNARTKKSIRRIKRNTMKKRRRRTKKNKHKK